MYEVGYEMYAEENKYTERFNWHGPHTPYGHCLTLCGSWAHEYPEINERFPRELMSSGPAREYAILERLEQIIGVQVNHAWQELKDAPKEAGGYCTEYYRCIRDYAVEHETELVREIIQRVPRRKTKTTRGSSETAKQQPLFKEEDLQ